MKILIVDDEPLQRSIIRQFLEEKGFEAVEAENGHMAIESFKKEFIPVVLLDHRMPDMNGDQVLEELMKVNPMVQVIMITAYGAVDTAVKVMKLGACDFLEKPVDLKVLLQKVEAAVTRVETEEDLKEVSEEIEDSRIPLTFIGRSQAMKEAVSTARRVAATPWPVLIYGETGTGKELMARLVHELSPRKDYQFVEVNCAAIPENLFESELFGHKKGAFTGAARDKKGLFEFAQRGTIFLDEIGELPEHLQAKLLRVLQEKKMTPLGALQPVEVDVRIVAATNRDLKTMIDQGLFRQDLYFRLNVFEIHLPPLRERREDIPDLVNLFLEKYQAKPVRISSEAMDKLVKYNWPGNVRELEHIIQRLVTLCRGNVIKASDIPVDFEPGTEVGQDLEARLRQVEKEEILKALKAKNWVQTRAAELLGISERVLRYKMKKYGIKREKQG